MTEENSNKIRDYFLGNLSKEAVESFLNEIKNNSSLKEQFEIEKQLFNQFNDQFHELEIPASQQVKDLKMFLESDAAKGIKQSISEAHKSYKEGEKKPNRRIWLVAASIIVLLGFALTQFFNNNITEEELFQEYYSVNDLPNLTIRGEESYLSKGIKAFSDSNFEAAISNFKDYQLKESNPNPEVYLYIGVSYQELEKNKKALATFDTLINSNVLSNNKGYWFKALLHLRLKETDKAKENLMKILENPSNFNYKKAKDVLSDLE